MTCTHNVLRSSGMLLLKDPGAFIQKLFTLILHRFTPITHILEKGEESLLEGGTLFTARSDNVHPAARKEIKET